MPYRGAFAIVQDIVGGQIDVGYTEGSNILSHLRDGRLKAYAVTANTRWAAAPQVPTIEEAGVPGLQMPFWHAIWAPKGTPPDVVAKLNEAVKYALADPVVRARLTQMGQEIYPPAQQTPQALGAHHKAEVEKWGAVIKATGVKAE